jgi:hypothetical protein
MPKDCATSAKSFQHVGVERAARRRLELDPHEEHADLAIVELLAFDDVRVVID